MKPEDFGKMEKTQTYMLGFMIAILALVSLVVVYIMNQGYKRLVETVEKIDKIDAVGAKLDDINKKFDMLHPKNPQFCVMHGWCAECGKQGEFRMLRADKEGYLKEK